MSRGSYLHPHPEAVPGPDHPYDHPSSSPYLAPHSPFQDNQSRHSAEYLTPRSNFAAIGGTTPSMRSSRELPLVAPGTPYHDAISSPYPAHAMPYPEQQYAEHAQPYHDHPPTTYVPVATYSATEKTPYLRRRQRSRKRGWCTFWVLVLLLLAAAAVVLPVYFLVIRKHSNSSSASTGGGSSGNSGSSGGGNPGAGSVVGGNTSVSTTGNTLIVGYDGTTVKAADGTEFVYKNPFGGFFLLDPTDPFNSGAKAQSWTPALNETWTWGIDKIRGVNLGGWLVPEPFIAPALYQKYMGTGATITGDEWTLSLAMAADTASGGLNQMEDHYRTFITEQDFAEIAGAGLNYVRLPMPYWAIETWPGEPFLAKTSWNYVLKAFEWARKYGLRVCLDLHTMPGAQNPWDHSGRGGEVDFMMGVMGYANAQRGLGYIRTITEFISQPEYVNVVPIFGIVNEPTADMPAIRTFYLEAHNMIRQITGLGAGNGPFISIHDQFQGPDAWAGFLAGSDRIALEQHPYFAFGAGNAPDITPFIAKPCSAWGYGLNASQTAFGVTTANEWSLGFNDCGLYINGVGNSHATQGCSVWDEWENYTPMVKEQLQTFAKVQMDALGSWFFWTWKIGNDTTSGSVRAPLWSYQLGLQQGWIPADPRVAEGACASVGMPPQTVAGPYPAYATGGVGAGTVAADQVALYGSWPPTSVPGPGVPATSLPSYTATGDALTLPTDSALTPAKGTTVDGWANTADTAGGITTIAGCAYLDPWSPGDAIPPLCARATPAPARREFVEARATPAPED